jgi:hypothetical protein
MTDFAKWAVGISLALLSFVLGGGVIRAWISRAVRLMKEDEDRKIFLTIKEFEAFVRSYEAWCLRLQEDFVEPSLDLVKAIMQLTGAIADLKVASERNSGDIRHINTSVDRINEQLQQLVEHSMQRRATDPPEA